MRWSGLVSKSVFVVVVTVFVTVVAVRAGALSTPAVDEGVQAAATQRPAAPAAAAQTDIVGGPAARDQPRMRRVPRGNDDPSNKAGSRV